MKGWYKHGACALRLWTTLEHAAGRRRSPRATGGSTRRSARSARTTASTRARSPTCTWRCTRSASSTRARSATPAGTGSTSAARSPGSRPSRTDKAAPADGGHAFAIVGYDDARASCSRTPGVAAWGRNGIARLLYDDWLEHAMDCWVAQLGVVDFGASARSPPRRRCACAASGSSSRRTSRCATARSRRS